MSFKTAELICTGSELLSFKSNRYVPLFSGKLRELGFRLLREHSVADDREAIAGTVGSALKNADLVVTCGGLGPTFDDLTRQGVAKALGRRLVFSKRAERTLLSRYGGDILPPNLKNQCLVLSGAETADNENGSAFGQMLSVRKKLLVVLPGPEKEWVPMFDGPVSTKIREFFGIRTGTDLTLRFKIAGLWETQVEKRLEPVRLSFPDADCTVLAGPYTAEFSFTVRGRTPEETAARSSSMKAACVKALGEHIYGFGEDTLAGTLGDLLREKRRTLALAESCTGGAAADAVTGTPGSSDYFLGGVTAYSNRAKERILGVGKSVLNSHGAVSAECAAAMAEGARKLFGSDYAASVTGIAGPGGGTEEKPVGLVHFAVAGKGMRTRAYTRNFRHGRDHIKRCSVNFVLDVLRKVIQLQNGPRNRALDFKEKR